jgi:hypothetical protein
MRSLRFLPLALLLIGLAPQAHAQVQFGVRAGLNVADFSGDDTGDTSPRLGFHGGVTAHYPFSPSLFVQPEVLFSQKGSVGSLDEPGDDDITFSISYIDVPVLLGYSLPTGSNLLARLYAGPQLSVKVGESIRVDDIGVDFNLIRDTDFGVVFGGDIGARRVGTTSSFGVGLRYGLGLTDIVDLSGFSDPDVVGSENVRNRVFSVSAFYTF